MQLRFVNAAAAALLFCLFVDEATSKEPTAGKAKETVTSLDVKASGLKTFYFDGRAGSNQVSIQSESTLEDFTTVCNKVTGELRLDPKHLETMTDKFSLQVEDLRTGIELRDQHVFSPDWLDAPQYPEIVVEVTEVRNVKKTRPNEATLTLVGTYSLHGKTNKVEMPALLAYLDESPETMIRTKGDLVRIRAEFEFKMSDYGITGPKGSDIIGLKVADVQKVKVTVFGSTEQPPEALKVDHGPATRQSKKAESPSLKPLARPAREE